MQISIEWNNFFGDFSVIFGGFMSDFFLFLSGAYLFTTITFTRYKPDNIYHHHDDQVPRRRAREPFEHNVVNRNHVPLRGLRRHCPKHLLWSGHCSHHWHDGDYSHPSIKSIGILVSQDTQEYMGVT